MKKINLLIAFTVLAVGLGFGTVAHADAVVKKVAVVDVPAVVAKSAQVQALKKEQQAKMQELDKWLTTVRADVNKQQTKEGKEKLIKKYDAEFAKKKEVISQNYKTKLQAIDKSISTTIVNEAKARGYNLVLSKGVVLYGGDDITAAIQQVVK
ncbi:OmpH family outer membrane protein [bacterium]|nr:OmpH family outer membrane protein [bacterium]